MEMSKREKSAEARQNLCVNERETGCQSSKVMGSARGPGWMKWVEMSDRGVKRKIYKMVDLL